MDTLRHAMKLGRDNHRKRPKRRSHPVESWRHDLDLEITEGWTAHGQTNHLLKTIACYGHVFEGLQSQALIDYTLRIALHCPGYEQYCRHQHDIERKVIAWTRAVENYYWPLGTPPSRDTSHPKNTLVPFNQRQTEDAQNRIRTAYVELEQAGELPEQITARAQAIARGAKVSQQTLYKHLSLWHPKHQEGVIAQLASFLAPEQASSEAIPESPEPGEIKELHPLEKNMKGKALCASGVGSDLNSFSLERGVRGDETSFPQESHLPDLELQSQVQHQVHKLGWSYEMICQFISDRFNGKRWLELDSEQQLLLLYYLQTVQS
ncbi:hypothetical protein IQ265_09615 [Nodosilinea sp. LEGE 06152]|uniref:hypothetical protein n=1 Tax=Nodosilinea sp. LEGE 06152 TaxID=2777966 RepID=UPI00187E3E7C|nr:hypothetical protein [Nodosilinea sp. LEGE 06152]MBE9157081.1 hypothetical protein [Nodosilinea sp. LEGE 06152]